MWYTEDRRLFAPAVLVAPRSVTKESEFFRMDTLPQHAKNGNPQPYTVYALTDRLEHVTWKDVRYVGLSINLAHRFQQHLSCSDTSSQDKNEWIRSVLAQGRLPILHKIEENIDTIQQGRAREQYWIRYAISQGADILNRQITYTEEERIHIHQKRAIRHAQMGAILEQGIFVKQPDAWYPPSLRKRMSDSGERIHMYEVFDVFFLGEQGIPMNLVESPDKDFDAFIKRYIPIWEHSGSTWGWEDRLSAIQFAKVFGKSPEFCNPPPQPEKKSRKSKKHGAGKHLWIVERDLNPPEVIA